MTEEEEIRGTSGDVNMIAGHKDSSSSGTSKTLQFAEKQKLIQESSWTKTVPYKHWHSYIKPTDSIGSLFTPDVHMYRIRTLTKRDVKPARWHPFADGALVNPPRNLVERHNEELKRRIAAMEEKKRDSLPENIVSLKDLADDTWLRKKSRKARILMKKELSIRKEKITTQKPDREVMRNSFYITRINTWNKRILIFSKLYAQVP